jgi:putative ABC transport system ATP-binding protein
VAVIFRLRNLRLQYRSARGPLFDGVDADISAGITAITGGNGAGKSTLVNLLGHVLARRAWSGTVEYHRDGAAVAYPLAAGAAAELRRREFAFALQSAYLMPHFTNRENLASGLIVSGWSPREARARADAWLAAPREGIDFPRFADRSVGEISGGEQKLLAIGRALLVPARVLIADEPFASLGEREADCVAAMLREWRAAQPGRSILLCSHDLPRALALADRRMVLEGHPTRIRFA